VTGTSSDPARRAERAAAVGFSVLAERLGIVASDLVQPHGGPTTHRGQLRLQSGRLLAVRLRQGRGISRRCGICRILPGEQTQRTEAGSPLSGFPTDRRRSDCLSESHQPPALRPRCTWDTRTSRHAGQGRTKHSFPLFAIFSTKSTPTCVDSVMLYKGLDQEFAEPGALSSTSPTDRSLPRQALRGSFVLVASRARRSGNLICAPEAAQADRRGKGRKLRRIGAG